VSSRYVLVTPALAMALAVGVRYAVPFIWTRKDDPLPQDERPREPLLRWAIPVIAVAAVGVAQIDYYFGAHLDVFDVQVRDFKPYRDGIDVALRADELPGNTQVIIVGRPEHDQNVPRNFYGFLTQDNDKPDTYYPLLSIRTDRLSPRYLFALRAGVNYAFFVEPDDLNTIDLLMRYFPTISPPQFSTADLPPHREYVMLYVEATDDMPRAPMK
jgi:hypothetical protein